ncbi:hypothetical protein GGH95_001592 [Coemansia sp. RSA 1836]|nr:hypothetical protein GGH95_001592 [Coemansia sp. RSA 1836]
MLSVYFAMLKSAASYVTRGRQLPAWDMRLQAYCSGLRHYTRILFPVASDENIDTMDFDKIHDWLQTHQMPTTELPPEIGNLRELSIRVSDIDIDCNGIRGIGLAEKPLLSLINSENSGSGSSRVLEYELIAPWGVYEKFGLDPLITATTDNIALEPRPLSSDERVILFFHGGSYVAGSPIAYREPLGHLLHHVGLRAFVIDYRLAPRYPFPAQLHDALIAFNFLCKQGFRPQNIVLLGDSAGGHLCLSLFLLLRHISKEGGGGGDWHKVAGMILLSPMPHLAICGESLTSNAMHDYLISIPIESPTMPLRLFYRPGVKCTSEYLQELREPILSPLHGSLADFPPTMIQCGAAEILLDDIREFYDRLKHDNPETKVVFEVYPDMVHMFHRFLFRPESKQAFEAVDKFLQSI